MEFFDEKTGKVNDDYLESFSNVVNYYSLGLKDGDKLPDGYVYIGRKNNNPGLKEIGESIFHNPFFVAKNDDKSIRIKNRIAAVMDFKKYLWRKLMSDEITKEQIMSLSGKKKVCFCGKNLCHGHVIEMCIDYIEKNEAEFDMKKVEYQKKSQKTKKSSFRL